MEIWSAAKLPDGDEIGEQAVERFHTPRDYARRRDHSHLREIEPQLLAQDQRLRDSHDTPTPLHEIHPRNEKLVESLQRRETKKTSGK